MGELDDLKARVAELEQENQTLRKPRRRPAATSVVAAIALVLAILLAPVATLGTWARLQLVDTDRFVATFAPLASDPDVQDFIADQVNAAIDEQVDLDAVVGELFDGLRSLDLPPRAESALGLLEAPAARGAASLIDGVVHDLVASDQFAEIWTQSLRFTHERATAIIQDQPGTALQLADDGVLSVDLGLIVKQVKQTLTERGIGIADMIPAIEKTVPIAQADALALIRTVYSVAVTGGYWLPWVVLGLLVAGVLLAKNRTRALFWSGTGFAVVFLLAAAGVSIGRGFFIRAVSPETMSVGAAEALFDGLTVLMRSTIMALAFLGVIVAIWAWFAGSRRSAVATRGLFRSGFDAARGSAERHGLSTGRFGAVVERYHGAILIAGIVVALIVLLMTRPIAFSTVLWVTFGFVIFVVLVELLRRPEPAEQGPEDQDERIEPASEQESELVSGTDAP
ncbi:hypothetical protein [Microbacterium sp. H1-D42]|uniref:hypothetical protein n=1 Tax=Microbacterium sp. H1-D42 TaxID=2925844 RepID=UPI001F52BE7B|nr:hypothetical protein [Microbacterium sp. H1-D42]UNK72369.1 hypothetical protein MNR00_08000 [Microbacterium sp. H1-D42]